MGSKADDYFLIGIIDKIREFENHLIKQDIGRDEINIMYLKIEKSTTEAIQRYKKGNCSGFGSRDFN